MQVFNWAFFAIFDLTIILQGDIEAIASKQATELTKVFEAISGSDAYKTEFDALEMKRKEAQDHLAYVQSKKKNTAAEKRQKKEQKAEAEKHLKLQQELVCSYHLNIPSQ